MDMTQDRLFAPSESTVANALIDNSGYQAMYDASIADPDAFWELADVHSDGECPRGEGAALVRRFNR